MTLAGAPAPGSEAQAEVVGLLSDLLRIDTSNPSRAERPAAEWVAEKLGEVGIEAQFLEAARGRTSVVARIEGRDPSRGGAARP